MTKKSKTVIYSDWIRTHYPITKMSVAKRKLIYGVGYNDADYVTKPLIDGKATRCPLYRLWTNILKRVYSNSYHKIQPTYCGVAICKEWLIFSNFRNWCISNHVEDYQLDKDLLVKNNRTYSPDTCVFVPSWLNSFTSSRNKDRGQYKIGVYWNMGHEKLCAQCQNPKTTKREHLGYFENETEAHEAWLKRKLELALELKPEMDIIDLRIYPNVVEIIKSSK